MTGARSGILDGSNGNSATKLLAITQLTSTNQRMVTEEQLVSTSLKESVLNYARLAKKVGMDGIVCSAQEAKSIVAETGESFLRVTPGIRLAGGAVGDQKRVMTPDEAARNQSSAIVVGRTITQAKDRVSAYQTVKKLWEDAK